MSELSAVVDFLDKAGTLGMLVFLLFGLMRRWLVIGWVYNEAQEREQEWKRLALTGTKIAEAAFASKEADGLR